MSIKGALVALLTLAAFAAPAGANVQVGSSGWQWGNPLPQGNTLHELSFAGATGYAVGDFGTLLKTSDGGTTWSGLPVGTFQGLSIVQAVDANTVVAGGGCVARRSVDGGQTFTSIAFASVESSCKAQLKDLSFVSAELGFLLLADGSVYTTSDGGTQFTPRTALPGTPAVGGGDQATALAFTSATTGFAAAGDKLFQTTDAGVSWTLARSAQPVVNRLWFLDPAHGFGIGRNGYFMRTVDGGAHWEQRDLGAGGIEYTSIHCGTPQLCLLGNVAGTQLVRTTDAGETPGTVVTPSSDRIYAAAFASPTRVAAVGANGSTVTSDDGGVTYRAIGGRLTGSYSAIVAGAAGGTAFAPGKGGALAKTTDGGKSWTRGNVPTSSDLLDVSFPSADTGFALDVDGGLFGTTNGGDSWKTLGTGSARRPLALLAPSTDVVLVVGPQGVRRSTDGGKTFDQVRDRDVQRARLSGVVAAANGTVFAHGTKVVVRSTDRGATWTTVNKPGATARAHARLAVAQVAFSSARAGLLRDSAGRIWRTTTGGRTWSVLRSVGSERVLGMASGAGDSAYLVTDRFGLRQGGFLLHSDDGGATWQPQFVVDTPIQPHGIAASGGPTDYLLAGETGLLSSTSGGSSGDGSTLTLATKQRRLPTPRRITVTGRLRPAGATAQVIVSMLPAGATRWVHQTVQLSSNGTFASAWKVRRGITSFVAQWAGDFTSAGAGSRVMSVEVAPAAKPKPKPRRKGR